MAQSVYSKIIAQLRAETGMNQEKIANLLQVSQATISRIEKDLATPGGVLAEKIRKLPIKKPVPIENSDKDRVLDINKELKTQTFRTFDISSISLPLSNQGSGDLWLLKKLNSDISLGLLVDCVGHGSEASHMAFSIRFGIETLINSLNSNILNSSTINVPLFAAIDETHEFWEGPPAIVSTIIDSKSNTVRVVNNLQPNPLIFYNGEVKQVTLLLSYG